MGLKWRIGQGGQIDPPGLPFKYFDVGLARVKIRRQTDLMLSVLTVILFECCCVWYFTFLI